MTAVRLPSPLSALCLSALLLGLSQAPAHAGGISVQADGSAVETLRFYTPASDTVSTDIGSPLAGGDVCSDADHAADVCAPGLGFASQVAGTVSVYSVFDGALPAQQVPLVYQNLLQSQAGLGVSTPIGGERLGDDPAIGGTEGLSLFFARPTLVVGFEFFDAQQQAFLPGTTVRLLVDEQVYDIPADQAGSLSITGTEFTFLGGSRSYTLGAVKLAAPAAVPEPGTMALAGLGLLGVVLARSRTRRG
ncbi:MAG: PEP-CTERM sorting domain-containing protein [Proteobacteria bacterium]|uniref:PEP-CTERM sorting domain-containing protein n=1 Tax=Aquabacterium sp. TaxID=1872578 RepID=UPI0035C70061|nr:PEP-CTERM sorting domain-containing protein [Pseudomonadota bacterium]